MVVKQQLKFYDCFFNSKLCKWKPSLDDHSNIKTTAAIDLLGCFYAAQMYVSWFNVKIVLNFFLFVGCLGSASNYMITK